MHWTEPATAIVRLIVEILEPYHGRSHFEEEAIALVLMQAQARADEWSGKG